MQNIKNRSQENQHRKIKQISSDCIGKTKKKKTVELKLKIELINTETSCKGVL